MAGMKVILTRLTENMILTDLRTLTDHPKILTQNMLRIMKQLKTKKKLLKVVKEKKQLKVVKNQHLKLKKKIISLISIGLIRLSMKK